MHKAMKIIALYLGLVFLVPTAYSATCGYDCSNNSGVCLRVKVKNDADAQGTDGALVAILYKDGMDRQFVVDNSNCRDFAQGNEVWFHASGASLPNSNQIELRYDSSDGLNITTLSAWDNGSKTVNCYDFDGFFPTTLGCPHDSIESSFWMDTSGNGSCDEVILEDGWSERCLVWPAD